jgi:hypothetical protein
MEARMKTYDSKLKSLWPEHKAFCILYVSMDAVIFMMASMLIGWLMYVIGAFSIDWWVASVVSALLIGFGIAAMTSGAARAIMHLHPVWEKLIGEASESESDTEAAEYEHDDFNTWFDEFKSEVDYEDWSPKDWAQASWDAAREIK